MNVNHKKQTQLRGTITGKNSNTFGRLVGKRPEFEKKKQSMNRKIFNLDNIKFSSPTIALHFPF